VELLRENTLPKGLHSFMALLTTSTEDLTNRVLGRQIHVDLDGDMSEENPEVRDQMPRLVGVQQMKATVNGCGRLVVHPDVAQAALGGVLVAADMTSDNDR